MKQLFLISFILIFFNVNYAQYSVNWHEIQNCSLDGTTNVLTRTSSGNLWNSGALSTNKLPANTDGKISYIVNGTENYMMIGFMEYNAPVQYPNLIHKAYLRIVGGDVHDVNYGALAIGDVLVLERIGSNVIYRKEGVNGTSVFSTTVTDPTKELYVGASIRYQNVQVSNVICDFQDGLTIEQNTLYHQNITNNTLGSIDVNITGVAPLSYSWSNGATSQDLTGLSSGVYTLTVTDGNNETLSRSFTINADESYSVNWHEIQNCSLDGTTNVLTRTSSGNLWNSGALSTNKLPANTDGKISYIVNGTENYMMIGFMEYNAPVQYPNLIHKAYLRIVGGDVHDVNYGALAIGDVLVLERIGSNVIYRKEGINGAQTTFSITTTDPTKELYVGASIRYQNVQVSNVICDFQDGLTIEQNTLYHQNITNNTLGSIDVNITGVAPLSYSWSNGVTSQDITGLSSGVYTLTVTDGNNETLSRSFTINADESYPINWHEIQNCSLDGSTNVLTKTSFNGWNNSGALSTNKLPANTDGKISYIVNGTENYMMIGFMEYNAPVVYQNLIHKAYLRIIGGTVHDVNYGALAIGDVLVLERIGSNVIYRKEGINGAQTTFSITTTDPTKELYVGTSIHYQNVQVSNVICSFYTPLNVPYHPLGIDLSGAYYNLSGSELHFSYYERYTPSSSALNYQIIDKTNTPVSVTLPVIPVLQGENYLTIDFSTLGLASGYYTLKVTNEKNEIKQLRFKI